MPGWGTDDILALDLAGEPAQWQRSLRWERPPRNWRRWIFGFAIGLFCTALQLVLFDAGMRIERQRAQTLAPDVPIEVELLTAAEPAALPPAEPAAPELSNTRSAARPEPSAPLQLFGRDGAVELPEPGSPDRRAFGTPNGKPLAHENPVPYDATRFDRMMPSVRESLGGEIVRKSTFTHTWHTRSGTRIQCATSLLMAGLGFCGWGVEPRATADELRAMRADPPMPKAPKDDGGE